MNAKKQLVNLIELSSNVKVYIPSTVDVDQSVDNTKQVNECLTFLSDLFGGATAFDALGCRSSQDQGLVKEKVVICESFCDTESLNNNIPKVIAYCEALKVLMSQEAISLEVNNKLYFV